jgi:hypothetical protein
LNVQGPLGKFTVTASNNITPQINSPLVPAQQTWVAKIPMSKDEDLFIWMADRWQSTPDDIKGHDFQYWGAPLQFDPNDGTILPFQQSLRWEITWVWGV